MIEHKNQIFHSLFDRGDALLLENMSFESCSFTNCKLSLTKERDRRSVVRNVTLRDCAANACGVGPAILEDVEINGLSTSDLLIIWGATFKHVTFRGVIGKIKINPWVHFVDRTPTVQQPFDEYKANLYRSIDWALDISGARFNEFDVRGIPAKLIRIDPDTQAVVTRDRALRKGWSEAISPSNTLWPFMIKLFLSDGDEDMVLAAPLNAPKKRRDVLIQGLQELRTLGVAEPA
jgi:hypothetical protein